MSTALSPSLIVLFVIMGAGAAVLVGYSIARFYVNSGGPNSFNERGPSQMEHMRDVRDRNREQLWEEAMGSKGAAKAHVGPVGHA